MLDKFYREEKIESINKIIVIIALFMLCTIPIIVYRYDSVNYSPVFFNNLYGSGKKSDIFNFFKTLILNVGGISMLGLFSYKVIALKEEIKTNILNIIILGLSIVILLSLLSSKYPDIALFGNVDRHEGAITWLAYLSIFFVLYNSKIDDKYYKFFYVVLIPFIIINLILSVVKLYGYNLLEVGFINNMLGGGLTGELFTTLYHPNFGSTFASIVFSISYIYMILEEDKKIKIGLLIMSVLSFATVLAMISSGGFVTLLAVLPVSIIIGLRFTNVKNVVSWSGILLILNTIVYLILSKNHTRVYEESLELIVKINNISSIIIPTLIVAFGMLLVMMKFANRKLIFNIIVGTIVVSTVASGVLVSATIEKEKRELAENPNSSIVRIKDNPIYQKVNDMSTDRLNIWMKSIDLINDKPILGHGFDTYPYVIIETDEDRAINSINQYIDKPHNWYLNIAYGCGVIGLGIFIAFILYLISKMFDSINTKKNDKFLYIFSIGVLAYVIQGVYNDSFVGTAIIFWVMAGLFANKLENN